MIPIDISIHMFAIYGVYLKLHINFLFILSTIIILWSMYRKLRRVITMTERKVLLLDEVERIIKEDDNDDTPIDFKKNNSIWDTQND